MFNVTFDFLGAPFAMQVQLQHDGGGAVVLLATAVGGLFLSFILPFTLLLIFLKTRTQSGSVLLTNPRRNFTKGRFIMIKRK